MPSVELVAVGTELLLGQLVDTNTAHVASRLSTVGMDVHATHGVGDNLERIAAVINRALERADGVITTGGLGPTVDDLTKEAVCAALGLDTVLDRGSLEFMQAIFTSFGREMPENNRKQAEMPRGAQVLMNPNGTAPGFIVFRDDGRFVACMPGVPREMKPMLDDRLLPILRERFDLHDAIFTRVIHTISLGESEIDRRIDDLFRASENPKIAVLAHDFRCDVKIMAKAASAEAAEAAIAPLQRDIEARLAGHVYGLDAATPESAVHDELVARGLTIATAESCTGGRIAAALTAVPGSSKSFVGGIVAYDNAIKIDQLGVDPNLIVEYGAVSEPVVLEMARGARERFGASLGFATTGVAGPDGGTAEKPVGLVWFALDDGVAPRAWTFVFRGNRAEVQGRSVTFALGTIWRALTNANGS
ncbi:MAG TPA: competence/damage-inducible protein A [Candidatus Acidoferrales bacterium]|nr:competence/damage-inducible protein A [Candidatus Acidoferrales bacterium]